VFKPSYYPEMVTFVAPDRPDRLTRLDEPMWQQSPTSQREYNTVLTCWLDSNQPVWNEMTPASRDHATHQATGVSSILHSWRVKNAAKADSHSVIGRLLETNGAVLTNPVSINDRARRHEDGT
jgi:hypothetical protein